MKQRSSLDSANLWNSAWRSAGRWCCALLLGTLCLALAGACNSNVQVCLAQEVVFSPPDEVHSISLAAASGETWSEGGFQVVHLTGPLQLRQGTLEASAQEAVLFIDTVRDPAVAERKVIIYLEGGVRLALPEGATPASSGSEPGAGRQRLEDEQWLGRLFTTGEIQFGVSLEPVATAAGSAAEGVYQRARTALLQGNIASIQQVQFQEPAPGTQVLVSPLTGQVQTLPPPPQDSGTAPAWQPEAQDLLRPQLNGQPNSLPNASQNNASQNGNPSAALPTPSGPTRVDITARDSTVDFNIKIQNNPQNPAERLWLGSGGCRVTINSPEIANLRGMQVDRGSQVVILADNVVAWQTTPSDGEPRWELYLEGNVVFTKGTRVIYCERLYYSANDQKGTILNADMLTPIEGYRGLVRLKADVIQQVDANNMQAIGAAFTSSRMGVPRYWLQSSTIDLERRAAEQLNPTTGQPLVDPYSGQPQLQDDYFVDSRGNYVYVAGTPVFYWPRFQASLKDPNLYLDRLRFGNDQIFGYQVYTGWDLYQLLNFRERPENSRWVGVVDYLSERGLALGFERDYQSDGFFGLPGQATGMTRSWFIRDEGLDTLGRDRRNLVPEEERRGRWLAQHRQQFEPGFALRAEVGYLSDRNFLEQFYERSWDSDKDYTTGAWLERNVGTQSYNLIADYQLNEFFTQTSWLPKFDHFVLGQPLLNNRLVWHSHSQIGYGRLRVAEAPLNAAEIATFNLQPWEVNSTGVRMGTRNELDLPVQLGPVKVTPYLLGDITYWQEDLSGDNLTRTYGQGGMRASLPFWKVDPTIQSTLWNVNGLAHKITFDTEFLYANASDSFTQLPLYDPLDDDAQEAFRHRMAATTFGIAPPGDVPLPYDERFFAFRRGMQSWVTAGSAEIADDLAAAKFGVRQRWQTKRGLPGRERIIDWISLDAETVLFPDADRDNFGSNWGLFDYDFKWHVGDRVSFVSDGYFDFFSQGLRTASFGMHLSRPEIGNLYLGYRSIEGPISSNILLASAVYRLSDKWGVRAGSAVDFGETGTIGQSLSLLYIGESFIWRFGVNADFARDNVGFLFGLEPRFLPKQRLFQPGGVAVSPAGSRWLE
ncbi:MAG: organic solvent tolerance protein OstA [Planctomycetota bacterium]